MKSTRFNALAGEKGFLAAYPNGTGFGDNALLTWNAGGCCKYAMDNNIDDVGFMRALIADISSKYSVDPVRVYVAGFSNGAMMAYRLACEAPDLFAAAAPVAGILYLDACEPSRPMPLVIFHGTKDENVPYFGGVGKKAIVKDERPPISHTVNLFAEMFHCKPVEQKNINEKVRLDTHKDCGAGSEVLLYTINGGGHAWPGGTRVISLEDAPSDDIDASRMIWDFFEKHPMENQSEQN
jgi:polyhydroxybutyrate depolymerase